MTCVECLRNNHGRSGRSWRSGGSMSGDDLPHVESHASYTYIDGTDAQR
jgi:hypothetical protein